MASSTSSTTPARPYYSRISEDHKNKFENLNILTQGNIYICSPNGCEIIGIHHYTDHTKNEDGTIKKFTEVSRRSTVSLSAFLCRQQFENIILIEEDQPRSLTIIHSLRKQIFTTSEVLFKLATNLDVITMDQSHDRITFLNEYEIVLVATKAALTEKVDTMFMEINEAHTGTSTSKCTIQ